MWKLKKIKLKLNKCKVLSPHEYLLSKRESTMTNIGVVRKKKTKIYLFYSMSKVLSRFLILEN